MAARLAPLKAILVLGLLGLAPLVFAPAAALADDPEPLPQRLREATKKAAAALAKKHAKLAQAHLGEKTLRPLEPQLRPLVALTLLRAGGPEERELAKKILDSWWADAEAGKVTNESTANYELALAISALEGTALERIEEAPGELSTRSRYEALPLAPETQKRLEIAVRALIDGRSLTGLDNKGCGWTYHMAPFRSGDTQDAAIEHPRNYDNSNTQFSVLALHDALRGGVATPKEIANAIATHFFQCAGFDQTDGRPPRRSERETGQRPSPSPQQALRWGYVYCGRFPSASMTFAGMSSLAAARELGAKREPIDDALKHAVLGLSDLVSGVPPTSAAAYLLYSLEKALDLLEIGEIDGKDWFAPLAEKLLAQRTADGLWSQDGSSSDDCLTVLFLVRATVSKSRVVDRRTTGGGSSGSPGEVFLSAKKKTVDAVALVYAYALAPQGQTATPHEDADEAVLALTTEGHGREACLYAPLATLLGKVGLKHETAAKWLRDLNGRDLTPAEAAAAGDRFARLSQARDQKDPKPLRAALADPALPVALRAFAASALAAIPSPEAAGDVTDALERLAGDDRLLATAAGSRAARALADALTGLARVPLPALEPKGPVAAASIQAVVDAAHAGKRHAVEEAVDRALQAYAAREQDREAWKRARAELTDLGRPALACLVSIASDSRRSALAFNLLRSLTGELIPDDVAAWKSYVEAK